MKRIPKKLLIIAGAVVVVVLIVVGNLTGRREKTVNVQMGEVKRGDITATVRAPGTVRPEKEVQVSSSVPGQIVRLLVREGDTVEQGQLLMQLDKTEYQAQVQQGRASLESAKASLNLAQAALEQSESIYKRKKALHERGLASPEELEAAATEWSLRTAEVESARQRVAETTAALNIYEDALRKTTFVATQSGVVSRLNVEEGENVVVGTMNVPGTVIMTVADLAHMQVECGVDETDIVQVERGQRAEIFVDAFPDTSFEATVVEVGSSGWSSSATGEASATDFTVKLALPPGVKNLKPGMTADAEIETATHRNVITVPIQAIAVRDRKTVDKWATKRAEEGGKSSGKKTKAVEAKQSAGKAGGGSAAADTEAAGTSSGGNADTSSAVRTAEEDAEVDVTGVFVVRDGKATFVPVVTGIMSETDVEVLSGLSEKDEVVTGPFKVLRDLKDGQAVKGEKKKEKKGEKEGGDGRTD
ncbi:MAG: efflux RND transporter periplasmic adaptor subunit [Candidatus Eisenbacteria bacterium]|nr:efflux RND transporter periplasmic adaptor subunit [Candidatus Eisenbacteria bacterium]